MDRKAELNEIIGRARGELREIEDNESYEVNRKYVGKFFKYHNCYSCPQNESDYWWLYLAVTGIDDTGNLETWNFQTDQYGKIEIENNVLKPGVSDGYIPIPAREFWGAWDKLVKKVKDRSK